MIRKNKFFRDMFCRIFVFLVVICLGEANNLVIQIESGLIQGEYTSDSLARAFRGIPYAAAPINDLRWMPPREALSWHGVKNTTMDGAACPQDCQLPPFACPSLYSEDCLFLNVFTPVSVPADATLPVMVFFHGGNFFQGFGGGVMYDGRFIAGQTGTILVSINYRLGLLGFMKTDGITGNFGIFDQQMSLLWVQKNIRAFGGDPDRVTIFGQSAGSMSVAIHLTCPSSQGYFHRAILESEPFALPMRTVDSWKQFAADFATDAGCTAGDLTCMRALPIVTVSAIQKKLMTDLKANAKVPLELFVPFTPAVGTDCVPKQPRESFISGAYNQTIPIMLGNTAQEATLFIYEAFTKPCSRLEADIIMFILYGLKRGVEIGNKYLPSSSTVAEHQVTTTNDMRPYLSAAGTDGLFVCANRNVTRSMMQSDPLNPNRWYYIFDHAPSDPLLWGSDTECYNVSCHGVELAFVFKTLLLIPGAKHTADEAILSNNLMQYWTNFAHTGDPNIAGVEMEFFSRTPEARKIGKMFHSSTPQKLINWPKYTIFNSKNMHFSTPNKGRPSDGNNGDYLDTLYDNAKCDWWDQYIGYDNP